MTLKHIISIGLLVVSFGLAHADKQAAITIDAKSINPREKVRLTLESYSFDTNTTMIEWSINNQPYTSGVGVKYIDIITGDIGQSLLVTAKATTYQQDVLIISMIVSPQSVDMVWEAPESYVPPFYEGKALPGEESIVRITAIPNMAENGVQIPPEKIAFAWFLNGEALESLAGLGKQVVPIQLDPLTSENEVKVRVRTASGAVAEKTIIIRPNKTLPLLYKYDDVLGLDRSRAIVRRFESTKNFTLAYEPYYLSTKGGTFSNSTFSWYINGLPVDATDKRFLSLRPQEDSYGTKNLRITVDHSTKILQKGATDLQIVFDTRK